MQGGSLDAADRQALDNVLSKLSERGQRVFTLDKLILDWQVFVANVERGYGRSIYEYTNDLTVRDMLDEIANEATANVARLIATRVGRFDERYRDATLPRSTPLLREPAGVRNRWWWSRAPKRVVGELARDLEVASEDPPQD